MIGSARTVVSGSGVVLRGSDIDTDRIVPARFLRAITFDGIEAHLFEDDRRSLAAQGLVHPFDDPARQRARVLIVGANFGCGSSREHAPQAIARRGIQAVVAASFAEIFFGNSVAIGLPCVTVSPADLDQLMQASDTDPSVVITVDLPARAVTSAGRTMAAAIPDSAREALISGQWDGTSLLLDRYDDVERVAASLPYVRQFRG